MTDEAQGLAPDGSEGGQAAPDSAATEQPVAAPESPTQGQASPPDDGTTSGNITEDSTSAQSGDGLYDPESMSGADVHKYWQGHYTRSQQAKSDLEQRISQYQAIEQNPMPYIERFLQMNGLQVSRVGQQQQEPQYDEYGNEVTPQPQQQPAQQVPLEVQNALRQNQLQLQKMQMSQTIRDLNDNFPDWQDHEEAIMKNIREYPTLANDINKLYRMSVPDTVFEARFRKQTIQQNTKRQEHTSLPAASASPADPGPKLDSELDCWREAMKMHGFKSSL